MVVDLPEPQLVLKKMQGTATAPTSARTYGDVIRPYHDQHKLGQTARNSWHVHLQTLFVQHSQTKDQEKKKPWPHRSSISSSPLPASLRPFDPRSSAAAVRASSETPQRRCRWRPASTAGLQSLSSAIPRDAPTRTRPLSPAQDLETGIQVGFNGLVVERELVGTHIRFKAKETDSMVRSRPQHACPRCPVLIPAPVVAGAKGEAPAAANGEVAVLLEAAFEVAPQVDTLGVANGDAEAHADPKQPPPGAAVEVNGEAPAGAAPNGLVEGVAVHGALCVGAAPNGLAAHGVGVEVNGEAPAWPAPKGLAAPGVTLELNGDVVAGAAPNGDATAPEDDM